MGILLLLLRNYCSKTVDPKCGKYTFDSEMSLGGMETFYFSNYTRSLTLTQAHNPSRQGAEARVKGQPWERRKIISK